MSLEQQVGALVKAASDLTSEVAGKMAAIDAKVEAKKAELDAWKNGANDQFANAFSKEIYVGGANNKWYPVLIDLPRRFLGQINILRYIHSDSDKYGMSNGALLLSLQGVNGEWGGLPPRLIPVSFAYSVFAQSPVADFALSVFGQRCVVWLLGDRHYTVTTSYPALVDVFSQDLANLVHDDPSPANDIRIDAMTAVAAAMIANNYIRGG
ncbi:hypothetical protein [Vogesella sp. XCS3]|uniref:hypothetical protein n=1 Tax=Vogesella sp. XCS3 TaxID=2877939 RepID=UPI001D0B37C4|nr:hypothetical protein [Vogesella sp. XCS3]UDM18405.1 hypothetical protein LCH97_07035 [Vogesella sp. XCS3]